MCTALLYARAAQAIRLGKAVERWVTLPTAGSEGAEVALLLALASNVQVVVAEIWVPLLFSSPDADLVVVVLQKTLQVELNDALVRPLGRPMHVAVHTLHRKPLDNITFEPTTDFLRLLTLRLFYLPRVYKRYTHWWVLEERYQK